MQEIKSYLVQWIKLVEKLDEGAFHRKHMFQVFIVPSGPLVAEEEAFTLYLQAGVSAEVISVVVYMLFTCCVVYLCRT